MVLWHFVLPDARDSQPRSSSISIHSDPDRFLYLQLIPYFQPYPKANREDVRMDGIIGLPSLSFRPLLMLIKGKEV